MDLILNALLGFMLLAPAILTELEWLIWMPWWFCFLTGAVGLGWLVWLLCFGDPGADQLTTVWIAVLSVANFVVGLHKRRQRSYLP